MIIKNSNLRRNLYSNRYKILVIIIATILTLCLIRFLNDNAKNKLKEQSSTGSTKPSTYRPQETVVLGDDVSEQEQEINTDVMDNFIKYCNAKEIEKAYSLLTDECKENLYNNNIENFRKNYVEKIYTSYKTYSMQSWITQMNSTTYKVRLIEDILSTGKVGDAIEDYYTIVKQNGKYKLNINSYVGRETLNKQATENGITINIISKDSYIDYEIYNIKVENSTQNTILVDSKQTNKSVYITGKNDVKYTAYMFEIDNSYLTIKPRIYTNLSVKFNKMYNPNIQEKSITFSDIINDVNKYNQSSNKQDYKERTTIIVEL